MTKKIFKIGIFFIGFAILSMMIMITIFYIKYSDKIVNYVINQINKNVNAIIQVHHVEISIFSDFPKINVNFNEVKIFEKNDNVNEIAHFEKLSIHIHVVQLIKGNIEIKGITFYDGQLNINTNSFGKINVTDIFKSTNSGKSNFKISSVAVNNVKIKWDNQLYKWKISFLIPSGKFTGNIQSHKSEGILKCKINNMVYNNLRKQFFWKHNYECFTHVQLDNTLKNFYNSYIRIGNQKIFFNINLKNDSIKYQVETQNFKTKPIKNVLPDIVNQYVSDIKISINIKGLLPLKNINKMQTHAFINIIEGTVRYKNENINVKGLNFSLTGKPLYDKFILKGKWDELYFKESQLTGSIVYDSYKSIAPNTSISGNINANLLDFNAFIPDTIKLSGKIKGKYNLNNNKISINKFFKHLNTWSINFNGEIFDGEIKINKNQYIDSLYAKFSFFDSTISFSSLSAKLLKHYDFVSNNLQFRRQSKSNFIIGDLHFSHINMKHLQTYINQNKGQNNTNLIFKIKLKVKKAEYNKLLINDLKCNILLDSAKIFITDASLKVFNGNVKNIIYTYTFNNSLNAIEFHFTDIDITELFKAFDNFKLSNLTAQNIKGLFNANGNLKFVLDNGKVETNSMEGSSYIQITKGQLIKYVVLKDILKYIKLKETNDVVFEPLNTVLVVKDNAITFEKTRVRSNAIDFVFSGMHSFTNNYEYHFKFYLSDIISKGYNPNSKDLPVIEVENKTQKSVVFISLKGKDKNYKISLDRQATFENFSNRIKDEKQMLKQIFKNEQETKIFNNQLNEQNIKANKQIIFDDEFTPDSENKIRNIKEENKKTKNKPTFEWKDE